MLSRLASVGQRPLEDSSLSAPCALWPVDLKLTHVDCNPEDTLVHFQGQYLTICELDYNILQVEIQNASKTKASVEMGMGEFCLVEDVFSGHWYRGRIQNKYDNLLDVFLLDHGNILTVNASHLASASDDLFMLSPKIICGFFANLLPLQENWDSQSVKYFSSLIGSDIKGYIQGLLPHKVLILEAPDINKEILKLSLGKHVDSDTFLLLVEMLTEVPLKQSREPVPDLLIEKQVGQEFSFKPSSLHGFENILSFCSPKLSVGKKERARVTAAVNPGTFYCQLKSMGKDLKELSDKLSLACESESKDFSEKKIGNLGLLCSVKGKDEKWHRGFVQFLPVNSQVRVLFVDYGFCESVKVENILQLPSDFLLVPIMAFPCALSCLSEQEETVLKKQLNYLKRGLLGDVLDIQIDYFNAEQNIYSVTLHGAEHNVDLELQERKGPVCETTHSDTFNDLEENSLFRCTNETKERFSKCSVQLEEMKEDVGYVEHILNPTNFWLRTGERNRDFEDMMKNMTEYFSGLQLDEGILENPVPGALCCAMYEKDMHYYRAVVTDTIENGAEVYFVDFGNTEKVPSMLIKTVPPKFALEPEFAVKCSLAHVVPVQDVWTVSATDYFRQTVSNKALSVHVVQKRKDRYVVDLFERGGPDRGRSIAMLMTTAKMAEYWKCTNVQPDQYIDRVNRAKELKQTVCRESESGNGLNLSGASGIYQNRIPGQYTELPAQHPWKNASAVTRQQNKNPEMASFKLLTFKPGNELAVRCSYVSSPLDFWCQLEGKLSKFDELMENIQWYYQTHADPWLPNEACCIVKCQHNGQWYRGCVIGAQGGEFDVIFVDIGMVVKEKMNNLRAIKAEYLELEGQAFRCSLYNIIEPVGTPSVWNSDASHLFKQFTKDNAQNLKCSIYTQLLVENTVLSNVVDLHTSLKSATKMLVGAGLAREVQSLKPFISSVYPYSYTYSLFNMNIGSKAAVYVTHVCSPWELYCQLDKNCEVLEDLMEKATKLSSEMQVSHAVQGRLCLAKYFMDGKWYRGLAYPVQSSLHLNVFFVDYGNMQVVEKCNVLPIPRHATNLLFVPMLALRCSLSDVPKGVVLADVNSWLEKAVLNKLLQATFVARDEDGTIICDLFHGSRHVNEKVRQLIAIHGHTEKTHVEGKVEKSGEKTGQDSEALKIIGKTKGTNRLATGMSEMRKSCFKVQHASGKKGSKESSKSVPTNSTNSQQAKSHLKTQRNEHKDLKSTETVTIQKFKNKVGSIHSKRPPTSNSLPNFLHLPEINVKPGCQGIGFVSHVNTTTSFYIQMESDEQAILKIGEKLNDAVFKDSMENITGKLNVGDVLAGEHEEDGALYRAVVTDVVSDGKMKVEFIDYGNEATVDNKSARKLTGTFLTRPRLSIPCTLEKSHTFGCDAAFELAVAGKPLEVEFVRQCGPRWTVSIKIHKVRLSEHSKVGDPNLLDFKNGPAHEDITKMEKEIQECCLDSLGDQTRQGKNKATVKSVASTQIVKGQHLVHRETMQTFLEIPSQYPKTTQETAYAHTPIMQEKSNFPLKSNKHAACKTHCSKTICQCTPKTRIGKEKLPKLSDTKINPTSKVRSSVSHIEAVSSLSEHTHETTEGKTRHVHIPHQNIRAGQTENGILLAFLKNGDFYVRLDRNSGLLAVLDALIAEQALKASTMSKVDIKEGLECLAKSNENNHWYRAVVQNTLKGECSVFFLDNGTTEVVSIDCIKVLCSELQQIPMQAVLCKWNGTGYSIDGANEILKETFKLIVDQNIKLMFVSYSETSQIWEVKIIINGMFLLQQFKATSCLKSGDQDGSSSTNPSTPVMDKPPVDKMSCAWRLTLAPVQMDLGHAGFAAAVTAPCEFHVVLEDMLLVMSTVSTILEALPEDLDALPGEVLTLGACCLVKTETNKKWCRAEIVHVDDVSVVINLVDYGHCTKVPYTCRGQLKRLPEELARLPKVTYPCVLRGIQPAGVELWTDKAVVFFQECICQKSLLIYFRQYVSEAQWEVDVVSGGINVAKELVDAGYATYIDRMLGLRLQQGLRPIEASQQEFIPSIFRNIFKIKPETEHAETENASLLNSLRFCNDLHRQEHVKEEDHGAIDDAKTQSFDERMIQDSGREKGEEASDNERCDIQETGSKKLTKAVPRAGKCSQM